MIISESFRIVAPLFFIYASDKNKITIADNKEKRLRLKRPYSSNRISYFRDVVNKINPAPVCLS